MIKNIKGEIVLVTGSSGCLGHHVIKMLISKDARVCEIRCLDLREPLNLMIEQIEKENRKLDSKRRKKILRFKGDIRDINLVEKLMNNVDCVIHCAAAIDLYSDNEDKDVDELQSINVQGTELLLRSCVRFGCPKFIHVSSFEIYSGIETIYYATENTLPIPKWLLFGPSATSKIEAENKVKQYSNNKLKCNKEKTKNIENKMKTSNNEHRKRIKETGKNIDRHGRCEDEDDNDNGDDDDDDDEDDDKEENNDDDKQDFLNAIIVRFPTIYGEFDRHYVSKIIEITKFFGGTLRRMDNIWIRQQPIYVGNAAWSLVKAKQQMDADQSISGEDFHITDETAIGDPFDFVEPYLECKGMSVTKKSWPFLPIWILLLIFFALKRTLKMIDIFGLVVSTNSRLEEAIQADEARIQSNTKDSSSDKQNQKHWYDYVNPQTLSYMCNSNFLNRTKASLRLDYEPIITPEDAKRMSLDWYRDHFVV